MNLGRQMGQALEGLRRNRLRTGLSSLGVIFAVAAVVAMLAIGQGAKFETLRQINQLGLNTITVRALDLSETQEAVSREWLSPGLSGLDVSLIRETIPGVARVAPVRVVPASISLGPEKTGFGVLAVSADYRLIYGLRLARGRFICDTDLAASRPVCVVGAEAWRSLGLETNAEGTLWLENQPYALVGVLEERRLKETRIKGISPLDLNRIIFVPLGAEPAAAELSGGFRAFSELVVEMKDGRRVMAGAEAVKRVVSYNHSGMEDFQIVVPRALLNQAAKAQRTFNLVLGCIAGISLLVGGIGIMNVMLASVSERTREIGVRRAVGAAKGHILAQFLVESTLIALLGGVVGLGVGVGAAAVISRFAGWPTSLTAWSIASALAMAAVVGILSGLYPAVKACRLDPVSALRRA